MSMPFSQPISGYPRADVEEFLAAAAAERVRLEAEIADANSRIARARSAIGTHRVMVTMLLEAQRELSEVRIRAEREAERIIAEAEIEAQAIERGQRVPPVTSAESWQPAPVATSTSIPPAAAPAIDLVRSQQEESSEEFFDYLRGALADDQPLGPRPE